MKLKELINRLEDLSMGGKNDDLDVEVHDHFGDYEFESVKSVYIDRYVSPDDEYDYITIEIS